VEEWKRFERDMSVDGPPFVVSAQVDRACFANTLIDTGCTTYGIISSSFVQKHQLERVKIRQRPLKGFDGPSGQIDEVAKFSLDVGGNYQPYVYLYIVPRIADHDIILGLPWMKNQQAIIEPDKSKLTFRGSGLVVKSEYDSKPFLDLVPISAEAFALWNRYKRRKSGVEIFAASMADIEKALKVKKYTDPRIKLPDHYHEFLEVFDRKKADTLPQLRGSSVDHKIELIPSDEKGNKVEPPWGRLYSMSREELLVLRKTLTELLDKGFIRVSNSPAAAPVLFVKKPGGGLRFCCDYRALNKLTKKDRYPLPLINETLERIGKARWFTKLDVIAAFHKIRIAEGDEWLTAFRTRYGLYEWLVTPFGLANAPSTFQRYINWTLRDFLDEFASAYMDDILVFSSGGLSEHRKHVKQVLQRLKDAGLQLDIDKCEFEVQSTKYLGFIIEAGKGIRMDPDKVRAIVEWETPHSVKGVRSFLGFANFYRRFIKGFSRIVEPLTDITKKGIAFAWTKEADESFKLLKKMFVSAPILVQFDPERETVVEADSSGWATGGVLSQYDDDGLLRPCAYFSRKNLPAECNYKIYDKELLAIVRCLQEWESELRSVERFKIITDHRNLRYFTSLRHLSERQMRWADLLSRFNFTISYRPGKESSRPDALSRREQDMPQNIDDERLQHREMQLLHPKVFKDAEHGAIHAVCVAPVDVQDANPQSDSNLAPDVTLEELWEQAETQDKVLDELKQAIQENRSKFPSRLKIKVSISECELEHGKLLFHGRRWVPDSEPLRTRIMQETHDSILTGHPGREMTYALIARRFFWPNIASDIRRFARNCDKCGANRVWKDRRQGLLKPLPIPDRVWREISIDFVEKLPKSDN
jgi:hypothetical protein